MSYDMSFRVKVDGTDCYFDTDATQANITWNLREMIMASTGLNWKNEQNNGLCIDIMPNILRGYYELTNRPEKYKQYESPNGWGTVLGCRSFFRALINDWERFCNDYPSLVPVAVFWIT